MHRVEYGSPGCSVATAASCGMNRANRWPCSELRRPRAYAIFPTSSRSGHHRVYVIGRMTPDNPGLPQGRFCSGYTAFTETAEPEEVLEFLREYHGALGPLVAQFEGTLDQFSGDGIMVFFNGPVPIPDPAERAVNMAIAIREAAGALIAAWRRRGRELGFGAGIAQGYATLGQIGFADRSGYTAIGTVCNLAARLCAEAKDGQILIAQRVAVAVDQAITLEEIGSLSLKGLTQPVVAYNVPVLGNQAAFRVIEGGAPSA